MKSVCVALLCVLGATTLVLGHPTGVPQSACQDMSPGGPAHNDGKEQPSEMPYDTHVDKTTIQNSDSVEFTLSQRAGGPTFAGFMVQARSDDNSTPLGTFQPKGSDARTSTCSADNDTASHSSPEPKTTVTLIWTPPADYKGSVSFYATVVETRVKFWTKVKTVTISVV